MPKPIRILLLGAGNRGADSYGKYALEHPGQVQFVAVAEPDPARRRLFGEAHKIPLEQRFAGWRDALQAGRFADAVINATPDAEHHASTLAALEMGYDVLLEKPIAPTLPETLEISRSAESQQRLLLVAHVLRYTDLFSKAHEIIRSGRLGQIIHISHSENVSYFHMAHSYVRGNWRNAETSAPMILAKCCHDLDLLYWFLGEKAEILSSVGNLRHFRSENAPQGAPERCTDGCPAAEACPFYAPRIYLDSIPIKMAVSKVDNPLISTLGSLSINQPKLANALGKLIPPIRTLTEYSGWPRNYLSEHPESDQAVLDALQEGPYGRCVYRCDNTVVDHQVVNMQFESGITATLTMHGHSHEEGRTFRIDGAQATLLGKFGYSHAWLEIHPHLPGRVVRYTFPSQVTQDSGHGGGDSALMHHFVQVLRGETSPLTTARDSLESHIMAFAAEEARLGKKAINMNLFRQNNGTAIQTYN